MQFKIPKFGFKSKKRGNAAGFLGAKLSFISNHLSIISNKLSQNNHLSIINDKLSKKRINYKLSIFGKKLIINYKLLIAVGVLALAATGGTLALNGFFGGGAAIPEDTMTRGLVGYWSFDEGDGAIARDASGNNNHGTLTNGPQWTKGKNGTALQFDGKDDYVDAGNGSSLNMGANQDFSIEAWVKYSNNPSYHIIAGKYCDINTAGYWLDVLGNRIRLRVSDGGGSYVDTVTTSNYNDNKWHHIMAIADRDGLAYIYIDGNQVKSNDISSENGDTGSKALSIGRATGSNYAYFNGQIDEVRIYNRALTEAEVKYHYNRGGPVAQWDMDEGSGSILNDKSGNNNDGTLVNGTTWAQGKRGSALSFDGVDDYALVNDDATLRTTGDWTRSIWVNSSTAISGDGINHDFWTQRTTTNKFLLRVGSTGKWGLYYRSTGAGFSTFTIARSEAGIWQNIVAVKSGTSIAFYIDGKKVASATNAENFPNDSHQIYFSSISGGSQFFQGSIDEVKIYDYARTEEEIRLDYNAGVATHLGPSGKTCSEDPAGCMDFGLAGHWDMDEGSGSILNDKSGNNNHGTLANGPKWNKGKNGTALQFDGKDDWVDLDVSNQPDYEYTITTWFYPKSNQGSIFYRAHCDGIVMSGSYLTLWIKRNNHSADNISVPISDVNLNSWNFVAATVNLRTAQKAIFINGKYVEGSTLNDDFPLMDMSYASIGYDSGSYCWGGKYFTGSIDQTFFYKRALSLQELRYHYNQGKPVAQWDMDEGSGSMINDKSGNGNDGTIFGATWTQGKRGSALSFDGADDYVSVPNSSDLDITADESFSYSLWLKTTSTGCSSCHFLIKYSPDGYSLHFTGDYIRALVNDSDEQILSPSYQINDGNWHYVEVVFDRSTDYMSLYVDGIARSQTNIETIGSLSNLQPLYLMRYTTTYVNGQIDEVKIYDYARTEEEIRLDYNAGLATHLGPSGKTCSEDPAGCMDYGLAGHWDMDEGNGSMINDKSGNNNHGTLTNGPQWAKGKNGTALQFDGKDDYVSVADSDSLTFGDGVADSGFSIESWVRYDVIGSYRSLVVAYKNNEYALTNNNWLRLYLYDSSTGGVLARDAIYLPNTYKKGEWIHLIVTYDGSALSSGIKFYLDGKLHNGGTSTGSSGTYVSMENTANNLRIAYPGTDATLDEVKIYNRALSAEEVRYHYNQGKPVAQWDFDEGEGTRAFDVSGNNNTGAISGAAWVEGKHGSALSFDGADDYVNCPGGNLALTGDLTISAWIKLNSTSGYHWIVSKNYAKEYTFGTHNSELRFYHGDGSYYASDSLNAGLSSNNWYYVSVSRDTDQKKVKFYVNGKYISEWNYTNDITSSTQMVKIGTRSDDYSWFDGFIDEVKIHNYARTAEQIMQDYNAGLATHLK